MKKLGLLTLITCSIVLLTASLFYWIRWQSRFQAKVISSTSDKASYFIGENIRIKSEINLPVQCNYEVEAYELKEGLKEHKTGIYFTRNSIHKVRLNESLFAIKPGTYKDLQRIIIVNSAQGSQKLTINYPELKISARELDPQSQAKSFAEITLDPKQKGLSVAITLSIIIALSLIFTLAFLKKLPAKTLSAKERFIQAMQKILLYDENSTSAPLVSVQDHTRSLLAHCYDENFLHAPIETLSWDKLSENDTQMLRSYLDRIFTARFHQEKIPKDEFQDMVKKLITWAQNIKDEGEK